ncbi:MAG: hypothetical protein KY468_12575 [Armatimonadetes bacterium]|nr:hypothetical protein [Armatimonadota bacterium]
MLLPVFLFSLLIAASAGLGGAALGLLRHRSRRPGEAALLSLSLGLALYGLLFFVTGFMGAWTPLGAWLLLLPGILALGFAGYRNRAATPQALNDARRTFGSLTGWGKGGVLLLLLLFAAQFLATLAPPTAVDALVYHLTLPKLYAQAGGWIYRPDMFFADNPSATQMLYLACRLIGGADAAPLVHWFYGVLVASALYLFVRELFPELNRSYGILAVLLVVSMPLYTFEAISAFVDLATTHYTLLAFWLGSRALKWGDAPSAWVAGLSAGAAAASKIVGVGAWPALGLMALLTPGFRRNARLLAPMALGALALSAPWFVKAWAFTGNPIWPLQYPLWGGRYWNAEVGRLFETRMRQNFGVGHGPLDFLRLPWDLTVRSGRFEAPNGLSLFLLPCLFLPLALDRRRRGLWAALLAYLLLWFFAISQQGRFLLTILPLWAALVTLGVARFCSDAPTRVGPDRDRKENEPDTPPSDNDVTPILRLLGRIPGGLRRGAAWIAVGGTILVGTAGSLYYCGLAIPVAVGLQSRESYFERAYPYYDEVVYINRHLPPDAKLLITDPRGGYYLERPFVRTGIYQAYLDYGAMRTPDDLLRRLRQLGVTHVWNLEIAFSDPALIPPRTPLERHMDAITRGAEEQMTLLRRKREQNSLRRSGRGPTVIGDSRLYALPGLFSNSTATGRSPGRN